MILHTNCLPNGIIIRLLKSSCADRTIMAFLLLNLFQPSKNLLMWIKKKASSDMNSALDTTFPLDLLMM